MSITEHTEGIS